MMGGMGLSRRILLAISQNQWVGRQFQRRAFARRAARRFMPGEDLDAALDAAESFRDRGIVTIITLLGENVTERSEADLVAEHYLAALAAIRGRAVDCHLSVKPTQLGLDLDGQLCFDHLCRLLDEAGKNGDPVWMDMESSPYVDRTLDLAERARGAGKNVGLCLQAYLHRTKNDLQRLIELGTHVRLVKGAYNEPASVAIQSKRQVDRNYLSLARRCLDAAARGEGGFTAFGTHDAGLIGRIQQEASAIGVARDAFEFEMLYGIGRDHQVRIASDGYRMRVLISYGADWFPWYVRRLAERPANTWFVLKNLFTG